MANLYRDDNNTALVGVEGLRPLFTTSGIKAATTGAAVAELSISALTASANRNAQGEVILRVACIGSNACYFSLGAASTVPADNTTMIALPPNSVSYFKARSTDASAYHLQITGASTLQVALLQ